jgi:hypothetical protein
MVAQAEAEDVNGGEPDRQQGSASDIAYAGKFWMGRRRAALVHAQEFHTSPGDIAIARPASRDGDAGLRYPQTAAPISRHGGGD